MVSKVFSGKSQRTEKPLRWLLCSQSAATLPVSKTKKGFRFLKKIEKGGKTKLDSLDFPVPLQE